MGLSGISPLSLILILAIIILLFGTKRLATLGRDVGQAIKGFRQGMHEEEEKNNEHTLEKDK